MAGEFCRAAFLDGVRVLTVSNCQQLETKPPTRFLCLLTRVLRGNRVS
jgi:hypothetical protein